MSLIFTPNPRSAPMFRMIGVQALMEMRLLARNGEQLIITLVIPLMLLLMGTRSDRIIDLGPGRSIDIVTPGVLTLAILSTSFTSLAIATGFERRYGVLKRLGATPLSRGGLLFGKITAVVAVEIIQLALLSLVALSLGWEPTGGMASWPLLVLLAALGTASFAALALFIAGTLRAEATLAIANLVYVALLVGGAVLAPLTRYPAGARPFLELLPSGALSEGIREAFTHGSVNLSHVFVLLVWALVGGILVARTFKWE